MRVHDECPSCSLGSPGTCLFVRNARQGGFRLFRAGQRAEAIFRVVSGEVLLADGDEPRALRGPGAVLGFESLGGGSYRHDATCVGLTTVCVMARSRLHASAGSSPTLALALAREAAAEVERWARDARGSGRCLSRLAVFLMARPPGAPRVPKATVASLLHMRAETLSRCARQLEVRGAIEAASLEVRDRRALEAAARS
jgi:CRP-like cAMP-binding protein